jgi:UDPglucose 6-dehydrogenase/UDP-N-acetyl-D-galactosamine dehydrogenase
MEGLKSKQISLNMMLQNIRDKIRDRTCVICIVGLGQVGLSLAKAFSKYLKVIGYDVDDVKVERLRRNFDTLLRGKEEKLELTTETSRIKEADFILVSVPTPVTRSKEPDLSHVISAMQIIGKNLKRGSIVVLESTVYPGVTEEIAKPILEKESGFICGEDFKIGYSPERINPGDDEHAVEKVTKVVAGMDEETTDILSDLYSLITTVYKAKDIKSAEAAKLVENIQRDLNIALMNELVIIFNLMGIDTKAVLDAAATKWNFHRYTPGLVGGYCIPVAPYYLIYKSRELGYVPKLILTGRIVNESMPKYICLTIVKSLSKVGKVINGSNVLIMGLTYKENVPDIRGTLVKEVVKELKEFDINVFGYDPLLTKDEVKELEVMPLDESDNIKFDCIIVATAHNEFKKMKLDNILKMVNEKPVLIDVKGIFSKEEAEKKGFYYVRL